MSWLAGTQAVAFLGMFIRQYCQNENGIRRAYWALVESYRTEAGPRQRIVSWLGRLDEAGRLGVEQAARDSNERLQTKSAKQCTRQLALFDQPHEQGDRPVEPRWVEVNAAAVRVENDVRFGGPWLQRGREVSVCKLQCFGEELLVPSGALSLSLEAVGGGMMP